MNVGYGKEAINAALHVGAAPPPRRNLIRPGAGLLHGRLFAGGSALNLSDLVVYAEVQSASRLAPLSPTEGVRVSVILSPPFPG